jgi:beta-alanine degradation protein BauB
MNTLKLILVSLSFAATANAITQEPQKVGPSVYKMKLENKRCRVFEITFKPGASIGIHAHPDHVVYVVTAGTLEITEQGKAPIKLAGKPGDTFFLPAQKHSAKNIGKTTMKAVVIELR